MVKILKNKKELIEEYISKDDVVLDVGFWGQGITVADKNWPHNYLRHKAKEVYGVDLDFDMSVFSDTRHYQATSAEKFDFGDEVFDVVFAGDIIEHLSNPGLFLDCSKKGLKDEGKLIVSTPNCFSLWNLASKLTRYEPPVNKDHTCYFNERTIRTLFDKNGWDITEILYLYDTSGDFKESIKKRFLNVIYWICSKFTTKFLEPMVIIAKKRR